jgi:hypothetical protein
MAIEVRNFNPPNNSGFVSTSADMSFDLVALGTSLIDVSSLQITIQTTSIIDGSIYTDIYTALDTDVVEIAGDYYSFGNYYQVTVSPEKPFDQGMDVKIYVDASDTLGNSMTQFVSFFRTTYQDLISDFSYAFIELAQNIPVYNEVLRPDDTSSPTVLDSAYRNWNRKPVPRVQKNQVIISSGYSVDYHEGKLVFDSPLSYNDQVDASYTFAYFDEKQIEQYFAKATAIWTVSPPAGGPNSIYGADSLTQSLIMIGAASFAFRELLFGLAWQEKRVIFDNRSWDDGWTQTKDLFRGLYEAYSKDWEKVLEAKKLKLAGIRAVLVPEFTLPGSRSRFFRFAFKEGFGGS